jgi:hypothetical protein
MRSLRSPCVCVSVYRPPPPIVARRRLSKSTLIVARQRLRFLCHLCRIKGKAISSSQNLFFQNKESRLKSRLMISRCCVCVSAYSPIVARQRLGRNPPIAALQRLGRNVTAVTNTHATIEELLDASFSTWLSYHGK